MRAVEIYSESATDVDISQGGQAHSDYQVRFRKAGPYMVMAHETPLCDPSIYKKPPPDGRDDELIDD